MPTFLSWQCACKRPIYAVMVCVFVKVGIWKWWSSFWFLFNQAEKVIKHAHEYNTLLNLEQTETLAKQAPKAANCDKARILHLWETRETTHSLAFSCRDSQANPSFWGVQIPIAYAFAGFVPSGHRAQSRRGTRPSEPASLGTAD